MTALTEDLENIEQMAADLLRRKAKEVGGIEESVFRQAVHQMAQLTLSTYSDITIKDIPVDQIVKRLQQRFSIKMSLGTMFEAEKYRPWLEAAMITDWYYWRRYKKYLGKRKRPYPPSVINSMDKITDQILDHLENPKKNGSWDIRGLVVGQVQSGKTANYSGVICKAADAGYKVIIVLAGMLNSLRSQTQSRIDAGFIGLCTKNKERIGAGQHCDQKEFRKPVCFTTVIDDFNEDSANKIVVGLGDLKEPVVLVIKKHKATLESLIKWLEKNNPGRLQDYPMLLIDDEADQASVNYRKDEVAAINAKIRELLNLFDRSSYLGYTATPFANIFIDPDKDDEMLSEDLFPRDFIMSLDPPDNYVGPSTLFADDPDPDIIREVSDHEAYLPLKHLKEWRPEQIPQSLKDAIQCFILSRAIRMLRGQAKEHNSMMINVSRFTGVQAHIKGKVKEYLQDELCPAIRNHCKLSSLLALENPVINNLHRLWANDYSGSWSKWDDVQTLLDRASAVGVVEVNSSASSEDLDYGTDNYPEGRNVIAVGGFSLSRGLTLEGLTVSYFLRNSIMYDTLMQMGRWFGYRDDYDDLCRIYMTPDAVGWYRHISGVLEEMSDEFSRMKKAKMNPREFGLCVRAHPESLIVTARNKMRSGRRVVRQIGLSGRLVETKSLFSTDKVIKQNRETLERIVCLASEACEYTKERSGYLWRSVAPSVVMEFVSRFVNHPESNLTEKAPILSYIKWMEDQGYKKWDVALFSPESGKSPKTSSKVGGLSVQPAWRTVASADVSIRFMNRRIASVGSEKIGLSKEQVDKADASAPDKATSDCAYRESRNKPLLMLHLLDLGKNPADKKNPDWEDVAAWGMSFPGLAGDKFPEKLVEYIVTVDWWKKEYGDLVDQDDEEAVMV
jgi:hypothetical protein